MKKFLLCCLCAVAATAFMPACSNDDDTERVPVQIDKQNDTAILLVTFGSTWPEPHKTYKAQMADFRKAFPDADIYLSFTSELCMNRWYAETGEEYVAPDIWLTELGKAGYKNIYVQSLHVIPGQEYTILSESYVNGFRFRNDERIERGELTVKLGEALLTDAQSIETVARVLVDNFREQLTRGEAVAFMGHGNPASKYYYANKSYEDIEVAMQAYGKAAYDNDKIFVGTVDYDDMLIDSVIEKLQANGCTKVSLHPLMSIAGDHANNDMAGDKEEGAPMEEQSWKIQIADAGIEVVETQCKGLGDYSAINTVWINHLKEAILSVEEE